MCVLVWGVRVFGACVCSGRAFVWGMSEFVLEFTTNVHLREGRIHIMYTKSTVCCTLSVLQTLNITSFPPAVTDHPASLSQTWPARDDPKQEVMRPGNRK